MTEPQIRAFTESDIGPARSLWLATPGVGMSAADEPEALKLFLRRNPGLSRVALVDGALVGTILIGHDGRRGLIHHLAVAADHRRKGLAQRLLDAGMAALRAEGIGKAHLLVFGDNVGARAFWSAAGAQYRDDLALYSISL